MALKAVHGLVDQWRHIPAWRVPPGMKPSRKMGVSMRKFGVFLVLVLAVLAIPFVWRPTAVGPDDTDWQTGLRRWHPANIAASAGLVCARRARSDHIGIMGYERLEGEPRLARARMCLATAETLAVPGGGLEPYVLWERAWLDLARGYHREAFGGLMVLARTDGLETANLFSIPFRATWLALLHVAWQAEGEERTALLSSIETAFTEPDFIRTYVEAPAAHWTQAYVDEGFDADEAARMARQDLQDEWADFLGLVRVQLISAYMDDGDWARAEALIGEADASGAMRVSQIEGAPSDIADWHVMARSWLEYRLASHRGAADAQDWRLDQLLAWMRSGDFDQETGDFGFPPAPQGLAMARVMDSAGRCDDALWLVDENLPQMEEDPVQLHLADFLQDGGHAEEVWDRYMTYRNACSRAGFLNDGSADALCAERDAAHEWLRENDTSEYRYLLPAQPQPVPEPLVCAAQLSQP